MGNKRTTRNSFLQSHSMASVLWRCVVFLHAFFTALEHVMHGPLASDFHSDHCNLLLLLLVVAREAVQPVPVVLSRFAGDVSDEARNFAALAFCLCDSRTMTL
ncbi:hypothetical protein MUK42_08443 [Musa troglodytarum]|uniref:Uncharacterized protein n=1 Tax=Musa troglodytarum TaxID=320322 RepID=A0A9E7FG66_9LILI|nr:hypothetical protein MUK42_08443 [Musa troglodytarum]